MWICHIIQKNPHIVEIEFSAKHQAIKMIKLKLQKPSQILSIFAESGKAVNILLVTFERGLAKKHYHSGYILY